MNQSVYVEVCKQLKTWSGHLANVRNVPFLEVTPKSIAKLNHATFGEDRWGPATSYLRQQDLFSQKHENMITALYTLISDESVHPLGTAQEYARLLRNMVIEYGVMFLSVLDKKGIRITY